MTFYLNNHPIFHQQCPIEEGTKRTAMKITKEKKKKNVCLDFTRGKREKKRFKNETRRWSRRGKTLHKREQNKRNKKR